MALLWSVNSIASLPRVHPLQMAQEHHADYARASLRDTDGFLWIATDSGIKRYDGYNMRTFTNDADDPASIGSSATRSLFLHSSGSLWVGGVVLSRYHPNTESFSNYPVTNEKMIRAVYEDEDGMMWIGGEGFGLLRFNPNNGEVLDTLFADDPRGRIYQIEGQAGSKKVWLATDAGLLLYDAQSRSSTKVDLPLDFGPGVEPISSLSEGNNNQLWVSSHQGLFRIDAQAGNYEHYTAVPNDKAALSTNTLWSVLVDSRGDVWVGTDKHGVHKYSPDADTFIHFPASANDRYRFPPGAIMHIYEDKEGTLWFTSGYHGLYRISVHLQKFTAFQKGYDSDNSLSFNNVLDIMEDRRGDIWVATDGGGVNRYNPELNTFEHFRHDPRDPSSISSDAVIAIAEDSKGILWFGTWSGGLNRFDAEAGTFTRIERNPALSNEQTLADNHVFRIEVDSKDRLLLAVGSSGLQIYDPSTNTFEPYLPLDPTQNSGIRSDFINDIEPTPSGEYWIAGYKGIELFSPTEKSFRSPEFDIKQPISDLHLDSRGFLWIATTNGLIRYNPAVNGAETFGTTDGLSDAYIVSIEEDSQGFLWLGTRNGLNRFDPRSKEVLVFDELDGLAGSQFNRFSHTKDRHGHLYFGGDNGFTRFDPIHLPRNEVAPKVHITHIRIDHKLQHPGQSPWFDVAPTQVRHLVLPRNQRDISLEFSGTNLIAPSKNMYRYRLVGHNEDWITTDSSSRTAHYSNLEPGDYEFQVLASNNEGVWTGRARTLNITILPAWWQTWWARGLYVLMFFLAMYGFSAWRLRVNRAREIQLQVLVEEQTSQLKAANRSIVQLNSELEQRVAQRTHDLSLEIEERRESEAKANYVAYHDALTGLFNRPWLLKHLQEILHTTNKPPGFALFFIGGDRFRKVNDTYGHRHGDLLLVAAAERLLKLVPAQAHAARLGSDEFTVLMEDIAGEKEAAEIGQSIIEAFKEPFLIEQVRMTLSVSVGFVLANALYTESSRVIRDANIAMQRAKDRGRGICQMFDEEILQQTLNIAKLEADLKIALAQDQFSVVYQPIVLVQDNTLSGYEILIRWRHPERGMVPPDKFIGIAESLGLISDIGLWVLRKACEQLQAWQQTYNPPTLPTIAVNLSPLQLEHSDFLARADEIFASTGVARDRIKFEITESALMKHTDTVDGLLESLRERGIELAIDDFGTGYSSLSYLDKLPVQLLKIDRSFVNALTDSKGATSGAHEIVRATISLAHNLNMRVVAEGIETAEQLQALKSYGCDYGQGYFIARPLSPEDATQFLHNSQLARLPEPTNGESE